MAFIDLAGVRFNRLALAVSAVVGVGSAGCSSGDDPSSVKPPSTVQQAPKSITVNATSVTINDDRGSFRGVDITCVGDTAIVRTEQTDERAQVFEGAGALCASVNNTIKRHYQPGSPVSVAHLECVNPDSKSPTGIPESLKGGLCG